MMDLEDTRMIDSNGVMGASDEALSEKRQAR
jgi:hypothetical protein